LGAALPVSHCAFAAPPVRAFHFNLLQTFPEGQLAFAGWRGDTRQHGIFQ
jgi:hypothetical protein